jgi:ribosome maturation factor RimP
MAAPELDKIGAIVERVAQSLALEVVEVEFRGAGKSRMLRIFIDKPDGVTHEDCANLSREVSTILDVEDVVPGGGYLLEVSSPGLDRKLLKPADYQRFAGSRVKVMTREPVQGSRHFEGRLTSFADGRLTLELLPGRKNKPTPGSVEISLANVEKANLVPEL